jgi:ketosteroid isomerase-like protein
MFEGGDITSIKEILRLYAVSMSEGDFDLWISLWADKGIQLLPYSPMRIGKKQIQKRMKTAFDQMNIDLTINKIVDAKVSGDMGLTVCTYTMKWTPKVGGNTINAVPDGKTLTIYERQNDGSWKIAYDCSNLSKRSIAPPTL